MLNLSCLHPPSSPEQYCAIQDKHTLPRTHTLLTNTQTITPLGGSTPTVPKARYITKVPWLSFFAFSCSLGLPVPNAYLSKASSLMPDNRFTLWLSGNCFLSSCRQVCKDVGRRKRDQLQVAKTTLCYSVGLKTFTANVDFQI